MIVHAIVGLAAVAWALMVRPGTQVLVQTNPPPRSAPTDTGVWFIVGLTEQGPAGKPQLIRNMTDYATKLGARVAYGVLYDALDVFFREGGSAAYVGRVVGPGATIGSHNLLDGAAGISLIVSALGPGSYSTGIKVAVVAGGGAGTYQIQVTDINNVVLENSGDLTTQQDAATWSEQSSYVSIAVGGSALPPAVAAGAALSAGTDDRANITDAQWLTALNLFTKDLGPGGVSAPGRTTDVGHTQLLDHAASHNRVAFLDAPDTATLSTLETSATNAKATGNGQYGALFAPWTIVPGVVAGTQRVVPPSALVAGRAAASDASAGPGTPAAGLSRGISRYATDVSQAGWSDADRDTLNSAGVDAIRSINGQVVVYGWRSLSNPITNPGWVDLGTVRYLMGLAARAEALGQQFVFAPIDGQGHTIAAYGGALTALVMDDWNSGQIYGQTPGEAFNVDVGPSVNTAASIAGNELRAVISVRPSPMAELVTIEIVNTPITEAVA